MGWVGAILARVPRVRAVLVDIVRDFFEAHRLTRVLFERYRHGELRFDELAAFIGDDEGSVLFRLKERCHALFRPGPGNPRVASPEEVLFDLAVGSLFHEAMKFRENFYQREVYGPRVRALRSETGGRADRFFREFEKILSTVSERLEEGLQETETLVDQTGEQLRTLMGEHDENGLVARFLIENAERTESVFGQDLDGLLTEIHGSPDAAYELAGRSYLASGYFDAADRAFDEAVARGGERDVLEPLSAYAKGMAAFVSGDYEVCLDRLGSWAEADDAVEPHLSNLAQGALSRVGQLVPEGDRETLAARADALLERIGREPPPLA